MDRYVPLPPLPQRVSRLNELANDLWWSWNAQAREVAFYERDRAGVPDRWTALMAESVATTVPRFSARRMVKAFAEEAYLPALRAGV